MTRDIYLPILEEIDQGSYEVSRWEVDFLEHLIKHQPYYLSTKQAGVVCTMAQTYLGLEIEP